MRYKYLKQILICFFCILFISSIILGVSFNYSGNIISQKQKDDAQRKLDSFIQEIDEKLKQFVIISRMFLTDDKSISFMKNGDKLTDELRALRPVISQNIGRLYSVYEDVALSVFFLVDDQFVYTNGSMYYIDLFFNSIYNCQDYPADWWRMLLSSKQNGFSVEEPSLLTDRLGTSHHAIPVIYILRCYSNPGIVGMYLSIDKLMQKGIKDFGYNDAQLIVLDATNNIDVGTAKLENQELFLLKESASGKSIQLSNGKYMLVKSCSGVVDWNCFLLIPVTELNAEATSTLKHILIVCCVMLAGCAVVSVVFSIWLHRPIRSLLNQISYTENVKNLNEFTAISDSINRLKTEVDNFSAQSDLEIFLNYLIGKKMYDGQIKQTIAQIYGHHSPENYSVSVISMVYEKEKIETLDEAKRAETYERDFNCFAKITSCYSGIAMQLRHDLFVSVLVAPDIDSFLQNIELKIQEHAFEGGVRFGISENIHIPSELPKAFLSAICAVRKLEIIQTLGTCMMSPAQLTDVPEIISDSENALQLAISSGNTNEITLKLKDIITQQIQAGLSDVGLRVFISRILSQLVYSLKASPYIAREMLQQSEFETLMHLEIPLQNTDTLVSLGCSLVEWLQVQRNKDTQQDNKKEQLVKFTENYINNHYKLDLSLEQVADAMHVSPQFLSQTFRELTGDSVIHYIQKVRLASACRLLTETDLPIEEIYTDVGFNSKTTFFRNFKQIKGITPSEYRSVYSAEKEGAPHDLKP